MKSWVLSFIFSSVCLIVSTQQVFAQVTAQNITEIAKNIRALDSNERLSFEKYLTENGIDVTNLDRGAVRRACEFLLSSFIATSTDELGIQLMGTSPQVQNFLVEKFINGQSTAVAFVESRKSTNNLNLFSKSGFNYAEAPESLRTIEGVRIQRVLEEVAKALAKGETRPPTLALTIIVAASQSGTINLDLAIAYEHSNSFHFKVKDFNVGGADVESIVAEIIVSLITHQEMLKDPNKFNREINMMAYDLKKLIRVSDSKTALQVKALADNLPVVTEEVFLNPKEYSKAFLQFLDIKREIINLAQVKGDQLATQIRDYRAKENRAPNLGYNVRFNRYEANDRRMAGYRVRNGRNEGYYSIERRRARANRTDSDSSVISTMAWIMDPGFMLTHPWYWGVSDNSFLAPFLMFQMLQDRDVRNPSADVFARTQPYDDRIFEKPIDPVYHQGQDLPVADPWSSPIRPDVIQPSLSDNGVTWKRLNGADVVVDTRVLDQKWDSFVGDNKSLWAPVVEEVITNRDNGSNGATWNRDKSPEVETQDVTNPDEFTNPDPDSDASSSEAS